MSPPRNILHRNPAEGRIYGDAEYNKDSNDLGANFARSSKDTYRRETVLLWVQGIQRLGL